MARGPTLHNHTKQAICSDYALNPHPGQLAKKYKLHPQTISRVVKQMQNAPIKPDILEDKGNWRQELNILSVAAVKRAVISDEDVYKSAGIAQVHLKGTGEYNQDGNTINVLIQDTPTEWKDRYLGKPPEV